MRLVPLSLMVLTGLLMQPVAAKAEAAKTETAIFAGGCFWCVESDFDKVPGVLKTISGYSGGHVPNVTYKQVVKGGTGHREVVKIVFDPAKVSYAKLLDVFWRSVDPTDKGGQFCDRGFSYSTAIYTTSDAQEKIAKASKAALSKTKPFKASLVTPIIKAGPFYDAEGYHQDYYQKNPVRYRYYRYSCGRDARVKAVWGKQAHQGIAKK